MDRILFFWTQVVVISRLITSLYLVSAGILSSGFDMSVTVGLVLLGKGNMEFFNFY